MTCSTLPGSSSPRSTGPRTLRPWRASLCRSSPRCTGSTLPWRCPWRGSSPCWCTPSSCLTTWTMCRPPTTCPRGTGCQWRTPQGSSCPQGTRSAPCWWTRWGKSSPLCRGLSRTRCLPCPGKSPGCTRCSFAAFGTRSRPRRKSPRGTRWARWSREGSTCRRGTCRAWQRPRGKTARRGRRAVGACHFPRGRSSR
jgi:hypothetical protein